VLLVWWAIGVIVQYLAAAAVARRLRSGDGSSVDGRLQNEEGMSGRGATATTTTMTTTTTTTMTAAVVTDGSSGDGGQQW
jgi:hypothetical protein